MKEKPELIAYSYYLLGGSASFYVNLFENNPDDFFDVKGILLKYDWKDHVPPLTDIRVHKKDIIVELSFSNYWKKSKKITNPVTNEKGLIVCSESNELMAFDLFRKNKRTLYFICHDDIFVWAAVLYEDIIDVIIAHNSSIYEDIIRRLPHRRDDIYFIPHGIEIRQANREINHAKKLKIVFLARNHILKGIYDLDEIDEILKKRGIEVEWSILGDGPEREKFKDQVSGKQNFSFHKPVDSTSLFQELKGQDIFILPSRVDGLPVALLETMSMGCVPIVSKFNVGVTSVVTKNHGFALDVGDNMAFAETIGLLDADRGLLESLGKACIQKIKEDHDIKKQAAKYFDLFKKFEETRKPKTFTLRNAYRIVSYFKATKLLKKWIKSIVKKPLK